MQGTPSKRTRRRHAPELKHQVVAACQVPGASVASTALAHGLNANLVRRWLKQAQETPSAVAVVHPSPAAFVALPMPSAVKPGADTIRLELRRGASCVSLQWPTSAAAECGAWLLEWLR